MRLWIANVAYRIGQGLVSWALAQVPSPWGDETSISLDKGAGKVTIWRVSVPEFIACEPRDAAYWRRRNRRASASLRLAGKAFASAVIDALQEGIPT